MSLYDLDESLGLNDGSKAAANLFDAQNKNPDDYAERARLQKATGTPAVLMDDPQIKDDAKKQYYMQNLAISHTPVTTKFATDSVNAAQMADDLKHLTAFEGGIAAARKPKSTLGIANQQDKDFVKEFTNGRTIGDVAADALITATRGAIGLPQAAVGWLDIPTYGYFGKGLEAIGYRPKEAREALESWYSAPQKAANKRVNDASGFLNTLKEAINNPSVVFNSITESAPSMIGGAGAARGILGIGAKTLKAGMAGPNLPGLLTRVAGSNWAPSIAGALGEGIMQTGQSAEDFRTGSKDGLINNKQIFAALSSGGIDSAISLASAGLAKRLGVADVDTLLAGGHSNSPAQRNIVKSVLWGALSEGILEELPQSTQEQMWQNYGEGKPLFEGVDKAAVLGMLSGMAMGSGGNVMETIHAVTDEAESKRLETILQALTASEASKLKTRSPDVYAEFAQQVFDTNGLGTVYMQADKVLQAAVNAGMTAEQIPAWLEQYGVKPKDLELAMHSNGTIALESGKVAAGFKTDEVLTGLQNEFTFDPNATSKTETENAVRLDTELFKHAEELFQQDEARRVTLEDVEAWEKAILETPGLRGRVTAQSLEPLINRANALSSLTGIPAIQHLNDMLEDTGLQAMKFKDWQDKRISDRGVDPGILNDIQRGIIPSETDAYGKSMIEFLREKGGLQDQGGDLAAMDAKQATHKAFNKSFVSDKGMELDRARELAEEAGYLPQGSTVADLLNAVAAELQGKPVYSAANHNQEAIDKLDAHNQTKELLDRAGVTAGDSKFDVLQKLSALSSENESDLPFQMPLQYSPKSSPFDGKEVATTPLADGVTEIDVDGTTKPALNSNGQPIHWSEEGIRNFWRWFSDSRVVDEQGRPLVVYHGSPDARFVEQDGTFRDRWSGDTKGVHWFTPSKKTASTYADPKRAFDYQGAEPKVIGAYLKLHNPSIIDAGGNNWRDAQRRGKTSDVVKEAQANGSDGVVIKNVKDDYNNDKKTKTTDTYSVFDSTQIKSATGNSGAYDINNNNILKQADTIDPLAVLTTDGRNMVALFEGADRSSFLHETGHIFLNDLRRVAELYNVQTKEWAEVKEWLGIGDDGVITTEQHEKFADHFEVYLKEGKAPTTGLRDAFRTFKRWLTKIYDDVRSKRNGQRDGITINPELADLFGRLMATEEEIKLTRERDGLIGMLDPAMMAELGDSSGMIEEYKRMLAQSEDAAREKMDKHKLVGLEQRRSEFRKQAQEEVKGIPVYAVVDKLVAAGGISKSSVEALLGKDATPNLPHLYRKDGLDVNMAIAEHGAEHGFESAGDFAAALRDMRPRQVWVDMRVAQLEAMHDATLDTQEAIRTAALRRMMEIESEWLAKRAMNQTVTQRLAMRAWADKVVANRTMKEIGNMRSMLATAGKHRKQAIEFARKGEWENALKSNEQARLNEELIAASYRAINANKAIERNVIRIVNGTKIKKDKPAKVSEKWRNQIDRILDEYGIARREFDPKMLNVQDFAAMPVDELDGAGAAIPSWIGVDVQEFDDLTFEQRQELNNTLNYLYGNGRAEVKGLMLSSGEAVADKASEIAARQDGIKGKKDLASKATAAGRMLNKVQSQYRKFFANMGILRFIANRMDGYSKEAGPAEQLVQNIIAGMGLRSDIITEASKSIEPALVLLTKDSKGVVHNDISLPDLMRKEGEVWDKQHIVAAALNMGNESNMMKLMVGYGLTMDDMHRIASKLTAEEWQAIQTIWNTIDSLWPRIADVHERLKFFRPKKIDARPITVFTADGQQITIRGGYYPVKYDRRFTRQIAEWTEKQDILASHEAIMQVPVSKSGFSKERTGVAYPIDLSLNVLAQHLNETATFIALSEPVRDADRVFNNKVLMERNLDTLGRDMVNMLRPTLRNVLNPEPKELGWLESGRVKMSTYYMGYNLWTAWQNTTGVAPMVNQTGIANYLKGIMHVMGKPLEATRAMKEMSAYMRMRETKSERDMKKHLHGFKVDGLEINGKRYDFADVQSLAFWGIRFVDHVVSLPGWWGMYNAEMEKHGDIKTAVEAADRAVDKALGSGLPIALTGIQRHKFFSLLAPFMSFAATQQENMQTDYEAWRNDKISSGEYMYRSMMVAVAPSVMSTFMKATFMYAGVSLLAGLGGGDNDKKKANGWDYLSDLIAYRLMGMPFIRDAWNAIELAVEHKRPSTARMPAIEPVNMILKTISNSTTAVMKHDETSVKNAAWNFAELASLYSGIPASKIIERWMKGKKDIQSGTGWWGNHFIPQERKK